jgi:uncharacterized membrane protein
MAFPHTISKFTRRAGARPLAILAAAYIPFLAGFLYLLYGLDRNRWEELATALPGALNSVAGIGVTVLVTTFSFVFVALSLVSVQFSPRAVRRFWQGDRFRAAFLWSYALVFGIAFVSQFFAAPALQLFLIICGVYLIFVMFPVFLGYLAENLNVASIADSIARSTVAEIEESYGNQLISTNVGPEAAVVAAIGKGFLADINVARLQKAFLAVRQMTPEAEMRVTNYIGSFVEQSSPLVEITPKISLAPQIENEIMASFCLNKFRNIDKDIEYGIRQLVDIAVKAISPAVNDPTTCVTCLHYLGVIVKELAVRPERSQWAMALEKENIFVKEPGFEKFVDDAFNQIYQWGKADYMIVKNIINILADIVLAVPDEKKFRAVMFEIGEMELGYLVSGNAEGSINLAEHRKFILRSLRNFYRNAAAKAESLSLTNYQAACDRVLATITARLG